MAEGLMWPHFVVVAAEVIKRALLGQSIRGRW